jgi:hypothetical protein
LMTNSYVGEVTEGSLASVTIQIYDPTKAVDFGQIVKIKCGTIDLVGAVQDSAMQPVDVMARIPKPLKLDRDKLTQTYPDLSEKMRLIQTLYVLGFVTKGVVSQRLPPNVPMIHDLAMPVDRDYVKQFHREGSGFRVDYMSRLIEDNSIEYPIDFVGALLENVVAVLDQNEREPFLLQVLDTYQKAVAPRISARMISELVERVK